MPKNKQYVFILDLIQNELNILLFLHSILVLKLFAFGKNRVHKDICFFPFYFLGELLAKASGLCYGDFISRSFFVPSFEPDCLTFSDPDVNQQLEVLKNVS